MATSGGRWGSVLLAAGCAAFAACRFSWEISPFERDGLFLPRGNLREGPGCGIFTVGETTLDEVLERLVDAPDRFFTDAQEQTVATWDTGGWLLDGSSDPPQLVWTSVYFLECAFDARGILVACTEYGPMPDPAAVRSHCGVVSGDG